jgi:hypothetical protein
VSNIFNTYKRKSITSNGFCFFRWIMLHSGCHSWNCCQTSMSLLPLHVYNNLKLVLTSILLQRIHHYKTRHFIPDSEKWTWNLFLVQNFFNAAVFKSTTNIPLVWSLQCVEWRMKLHITNCTILRNDYFFKTTFFHFHNTWILCLSTENTYIHSRKSNPGW